MKKINKSKRILSLVLAAGLLADSLPAALAAPPAPTYDEAFYVTLDPYGAVKDSSIVKSYSLNGSSSIVDHGAYEKVTNMTNYAEPSQGEDTVSFDFSDEIPDRFYFEGKTAAPLSNLPWTIDVSYKLNGVPTAAEKLAGEKGLVEISIDLTPNTSAPEYYRNNMILQAAAMVDADKALSVEAPGAQVQTVGNLRAVIFMAMPGESQHFELRIGSNDFSFAGLTFLMIPATLAQLDQIADLREVKGKIEDSADAMSDSLDVIFSTMSAMQGSLNTTASGLEALDRARGIIAGGKGAVYASADEALADLSKITDALAPVDGHLTTAQAALTDTNTQLNSMVENITTLKTQLEETRGTIEKIQADLEGIKNMLADFDKLSGDRKKLSEDFTVDIQAFQRQMQLLSDSLDDLRIDMEALPKLGKISEITQIDGMSLSEIQAAISGLDAATSAAGGNYTSEQLIASLGVPPSIARMYISGNLPQSLQTIEIVNSVIRQTNNIVGQVNSLMDDLSDTIPDVLIQLSSVCDLLGTGKKSLMADLADANKLLGDYLDAVDARNGDLTDLVDQANQVGTILSEASLIADTAIDQIGGLNEIVNLYEPSLQQALEDAKLFSDAATTGITSMKTFLSSFESLLKKSGTQLNTGAQQSLAGLSAALRKSATGLGQTGVIQNAKDTIKNLIDDEWDSHTGEENNILNMDSEAVPLSLTSSDNPPPQSLQILMRTEEITVKNDDKAVDQDEEFRAKGTFLSRVGSVFQKIWRSFTGLFS